VVEWCLKIPIHSLLETSEFDKGCLYNVFEVNIILSTDMKEIYLAEGLGEIGM
jgi:hypothetical protein